MSSVPVTRRKIMKMLMILSSDCSNHTIIYRTYTERTTETGSRRDEGQWMQQSEYKVSAVLKGLKHTVMKNMEKPASFFWIWSQEAASLGLGDNKVVDLISQHEDICTHAVHTHLCPLALKHASEKHRPCATQRLILKALCSRSNTSFKVYKLIPLQGAEP